MADTVYVTDPSPAVFFAALADQIKAGFYADDSVAGFPHFDILNEVKLTRTDKPSQRHDHTNFNEIHITAWHNTNFVLDYQDAVLQGFEVDPESIKLGDPFQPHYLVMRRAGAAKQEAPQELAKVEVSSGEKSLTDLEPKAQDDVLDALTFALDKVADSKEEAEKPVKEVVKPRKGGRPPKSKEV